MPRPLEAVVVAGLVAAALAPAAVQAKDGVKLRHRVTVSIESAVDSNARRVPAGTLDRPDLLAYLFATGHLELRGRSSVGRLDVEAGGKGFAAIHAEDMLVGRIAARYDTRIFRRGLLGFEADYKDEVQEGDLQADLDPASPLACTPPAGVPYNGYRCNRRDYRDGRVSASLDVAPWRPLDVALSVGGSGFQYKPNPIFSYLAGEANLGVHLRLGRHHVLGASAGFADRFYDPHSTTYRLVPSPGGTTVEATGTPRIEQVFTTGLSYSYRGPLVLTASWTLARSVNNGYAMDVWRNRFELAAATRLGPKTTLVVSAAVQTAYYPEGNVYRKLSLFADESEQQNGFAVKLSQRLTRHLRMVVKAQAYSNEISAEALPFSRQVFQTGIEIDL